MVSGQVSDRYWIGMVDLSCQRVTFHSPGDEAAFFSWITGIASIQNVSGLGDVVCIQVPSTLSDEALRELLAVFHR
jgi:hypothetical protein